MCRLSDFHQGLKPIDSIDVSFGTAEAEPCYKTHPKMSFPQPVKSRPFKAGLHKMQKCLRCEVNRGEQTVDGGSIRRV
jgi:hypothetical protein